MKKLVRESLFEAKQVHESNSFGEKRALQLVKKYMPFLKNVQYDDLGTRGTQDDPAYGQDEQYAKWDQLSFETGIEQIDEVGPVVYLLQDFDSDQIYAKIYLDTVNFNGYGESNDEYTSELDPIALEDWNEERYESVVEDLKEAFGVDENEEGNDKDYDWEDPNEPLFQNRKKEYRWNKKENRWEYIGPGAENYRWDSTKRDYVPK